MKCTLVILDPTLKFFLEQDRFDSYTEFVKSIKSNLAKKMYIPLKGELKKIEPTENGFLVDNLEVKGNGLVTLLLSGMLESNDPQEHFESFLDTLVKLVEKYESDQNIPTEEKNDDRDFLNSLVPFFNNYPVEESFQSNPVYQTYLGIRERINALFNQIEKELDLDTLEDEIRTDESAQQDVQKQAPYEYTQTFLYRPSKEDVLQGVEGLSVLKHNVSQEVENQIAQGERFAVRFEKDVSTNTQSVEDVFSLPDFTGFGVVGVLYKWEGEWKRVYIESFDDFYGGKVKLTTDPNKGVPIGANKQKGFTLTLPNFEKDRYANVNDTVRQVLIDYKQRVQKSSTPSSFLEIKGTVSDYPKAYSKIPYSERVITAKTFLQGKPNKLVLASKDDKINYAGNLYLDFNGTKVPLDRTPLSESWQKRVLDLVNHTYTQEEGNRVVKFLNALLDFKGGDIQFSLRGNKIKAQKRSTFVDVNGVKVFNRIDPTDVDLTELSEVLSYARINVHKDWVGQTVLTPIIFNGELKETNTNFEEFYLEHHQTVFRQIKLGKDVVYGPIKSLLFDVKYESPELTRDKEFQENPKVGNLEITQDEVIPLEKITDELLNMSNKVQGDLKDVLVVLNALIEKPEVKKKLQDATIKFVTTYSKDFKGMADDKEILINFALINNPANYEIIVHEIVHVLTSEWISKNPEHELTKQLNELVTQVPDSVVEIIEKAGYKKEDPRFVYEVLARLTDPNVIKELKKVKSKNKTLFEKLKEVVKDILSQIFNLKKEPSLYAEFLESLVSISLEPTTPKTKRDRFRMDTKSLSLGYDENSLKEVLNQGFSETYLNQSVRKIDAGIAQFIFDQGFLPQLLEGQLGFENVFGLYNNFLLEYLEENESILSKEEVDYLDKFFLPNNEFLRDYWIENTTLVRVRKHKKGEKPPTIEVEDDLENDPNEVEENENPEKEQDTANITGGETENEKVGDFDRSGVKESSLESADPISRAFVKLIPKIERVNGVTKIYSDEERKNLIDKGTHASYFTKVPNGWIKYKTDSTGSLELNDYTETWNLIATLFANKMTLEEMLDSLNESALDIVPEVFVLRNRLNITNPNDWDVDLNLRIETAFKKATVDTYVMIKSESGRYYFKNESKDIQSNGKKKIDSNFLRKVNDEFLEFYDRESDQIDIKRLFTHLGILKEGKVDLGNKLLVELLGFGFHPKTLRENGMVSQEILALEPYLVELLLNLEKVSISISESIFNGGTVGDKKYEGLSGLMNKVLSREDSIRPLSTTTMVKNAEGENQSTLSQLNAILQYRNLLNKARTKEELLEEYERLKNPMFEYSLTKQVLFPQIVDETTNSLVEQRSNVKVEVELLNGFKKEQKGRASEGNLTIDLDDASWLSLNFIGMVKHGIIENTRAETASTSYFFRLSNWQPNVPGGSHTPFSFSDVNPEFNRKDNQFDLSTESKLYKVWENYLKGELSRIKSQGEVKWGLFDSILNKDEKEILLKGIDPDTLKNALNRFFTEQYDEYDKLFEKTMGGVNALVGEYATYRGNQEVYGDKGLWNLLDGKVNTWKAFYVINSMTLHTEEAILFQGDLSQTPKYYKRAKGVQSTGTPLSLSKTALESTNKRLRENSFGAVFGYPFQLGRTYKSSTLKDDIKPSAYKDDFLTGFVESQKLYYKELGITKTEEDIIKDANKLLFPKEEGYKAVNIGDGGGVSLPDFHWAMLRHVGNISLEQQQVYDALVLDAKAHAKDYLGEGFVNTPLTKEEKEKVKIGFDLMSKGKGQFPLAKFTHRNTMIGSDTVVKPEIMDKFALFPLFPQFVQDKPVAKALLISMMKSETGYVKFQSGTKIDSPDAVDFISMVERGELEVTLSTHELKTDFLREQIKTPNKHKEKNTFGSQVRKNILAELGKVKLFHESFKGEFKLEWEKLNQEFSLEVKKEVLGKLGIEETPSGWDFVNVDKAKVAKILYEESVARDLPLNLKTYFDKYKRGVLDPESLYDYFEASMGAQQIQNLLASIIKKISVQKLEGSQYRQVPSSFFDRQIKSNGKTRELGFYRFEKNTTGITKLPNGNLLIKAYRTEQSNSTSKNQYQRGKGLYLSLENPYPGTNQYVVEFEISPNNLLDRRKESVGNITEDSFIKEKNKRKDKNLDTLHEFKLALGIKVEIGSIDGLDQSNEIVIFDTEIINTALSNKKPIQTVSAAECKIGMGGSFLNLLNLQDVTNYIEYRQLEDTMMNRLMALNKKLEDDSWVERNKEVLTIIAYRIPNQGHNSDEVFIIREFLPPFHAGEIILPPEVTTQSGTDYDYDKMSAIVPSIGKNGKLITKGSKGIQNEMIKTISKILLDPVNYHKLIVPNSNHIIFDFLKKDLLPKLYPDLRFDKMSPTEIITLKRNLRQFVSVQGKNLLGIAAVWNPFTVLVQNHEVTIQDSYKKEIGFGKKAVTLEVPVNPLMGSTESSTVTKDNLNKLEVISQLINVTVDMPSDDTFGMAGFTRDDFAAFIYSMSMLNYGFEDSMNLFHQPIIFKYKSMVKDLMRKGKKRYKANVEVLSALLDIPLVETEAGINYTKSEIEIFKQLTELEQGFDKSKFNVLSIEEALSKNKFSDSQKAFLAHYIKLVDQSGQVRTVQSALNFDTSPDNNLAKAKDRIKNYNEAKKVGIITSEKIDEIQYNSVISGLYATDILENLTTSLFPILYSEENKTLFDEIRESFVQSSEQAFRKASNDFLLAILQNYGKINNRSLINIAKLYIEGSKKADIIRGARETQKKLFKEGKNYRLLDILVANVSKPNKTKRINPQLIMGMENSAADKDQLTEEFRELLNHSDESVKNFAIVLAVTGLIQSGWSKSPLYFSDVIPEEFITPIIRESLREYERTSNLEKAAFRSQFEKNFNYYEGKSLGRKSTNTTSYHEDSYRLMDYTRGVQDRIEYYGGNNKTTITNPVVQDIENEDVTVEPQLSQQPDIFLERVENLTKQESQLTEDKFKYYGTFYNIKLEEGKAVDVINLKQSQSETNKKFQERKGKILDAYNTNPNVDPQSSKPWRSEVEPAKAKIEESSTTENYSYIFKDGFRIDVPFNLNEEQRKALSELEDFVNSKGTTITLSGAAGTGKTTVMSIFDKWLNKKKYIYPKYTAPTHRANAVTKLMNPSASVYTLHSLFGLTPDIELEEGNYDVTDLQYAQKNKPKIEYGDVLIIDESSMVNDDLFTFLSSAQKENNIRIIYVGDAAQLKPVKAKKKSKVFEEGEHKVLQLLKVERTGDNAILKESVNVRENRGLSYQSEFNSKGEGVEYISTREEMFRISNELFREQAQSDNKLLYRILSATNKAVEEVNDMIRKVLYDTDEQLVVGELIMGYDNFDYNYKSGQFKLYNGGDYEITSVKKTTKKVFEIDETFSGYQITIQNVFNSKEAPYSLFVVDKEEDDTKAIKLANIIQELNKNAQKAMTVGQTKEGAAMFAQANKLKSEVAFMKNITKLDTNDNKQKVVIKKTFDYGYAHTIHKSQGGSYNNVMILDDTIAPPFDSSTQQELKYVAISRARENAYVRTNKPIKQPVLEQVNVDMSKLTNHSGGAYGGDTFWDIIGREFGVTEHKHYRDSGNQSLSKQLRDNKVTATVLTKEQMNKARTELEALLGEKYPDTIQGNLQVRNYYQVINSDAVFAIAKLDNSEDTSKPDNLTDPTKSIKSYKFDKVKGGTNTAVQLGIKLNKPVYVWNITSEKWYKYDGFQFVETETPTLTKNFAGVGSRDIENYNVQDKETGNWVPRKEYVGKEKEEKAKQAIRDVYQKTQKQGIQKISPTQKQTNVAKSENLWSGSNDPFAAALTNPTTIAKRKGKVSKDYPVTFKGKTYVDAEAAYKQNKVDDLVLAKQGKIDSRNNDLMVEILVAKLNQYPELITELTKRGGVKWLEQSEHTVNGNRFEGKGRQSPFISNLIKAYELVLNKQTPGQQSLFGYDTQSLDKICTNI